MQNPNRNVGVSLGVKQNFWKDARVKRSVFAIARNGYNPTMYTPIDSKKDEKVPVEEVNIKYIKVPFKHFGLGIVLNHIIYNIILAKSVNQDKVNIYHCNDFDTFLSGILVKLLSLGRTRIIFDSHENYPLVTLQYQGKMMSRLHEVIETIYVKCFVDYVITVNDGLRKKFLNLGARCITVLNTSDLSMIKYKNQKTKNIINSKNEFRIVYFGGIQHDRGYLELVDAVDYILREEAINLRVYIIGGGGLNQYDKIVKKKVNQKGLGKYFVFTGFMKLNEAFKFLETADVGLILFQPIPNNICAGPPNKLFEYMITGTAVIASDFPHIRSIMNEKRFGISVDPEKIDEIAKAIKYMYHHPNERKRMRKNAKELANTKYNWNFQSKNLLKVYEEIFLPSDKLNL